MAAAQAFQKIFPDKKIGAVIAVSPKTGEILAAMSQPSFDPTAFARGVSPQIWSELLNNEYRPLRDKTIQDHYMPGSTFKVVTLIAGLEEKEIDESFTVHCTGSIRVGNRPFHCHKKGGHGVVDPVQALAQSCDTFFYRVGQKLGIDRIAKYATMLGLGKRTGVNLAHEETGLIPTEEWKRQRFGQVWTPGETPSCAIGQSYVLTTPIQLANLYAAIATGGFLWRPFLVKYIESPDGRILKEFQPESLAQAKISTKTLDIVRKGLWHVLNDPRGTAYYHRIPGFDVSGKTGTSQVVGVTADKVYAKCKDQPFNLRDNGLFVAYAPPDDPSIAVAVVAEHGCHGSTSAAPIAMAVIKTYLQKYMPQRYGDEAIRERLKKNAPARRTALEPRENAE